MTLDEFAKLCDDGGLTIVEESNHLAQLVAWEILKELLISTPVDTGRARCNWQTELIVSNDTVKYDKPDKPSSPSAAEEEAKQQFREAIKDYDGEPIHITNNLVYIWSLNNGTSSQAAAGFVERAMQTASTYVKTKTRFNPFHPDIRSIWEEIS